RVAAIIANAVTAAAATTTSAIAAAAAPPAPPPSLGQELATLRDEIRSLQEEVRVLRGQIQAGQCQCAAPAAAAAAPVVPAAAPPPPPHRPAYMAPTVAAKLKHSIPSDASCSPSTPGGNSKPLPANLARLLHLFHVLHLTPTSGNQFLSAAQASSLLDPFGGNTLAATTFLVANASLGNDPIFKPTFLTVYSKRNLSVASRHCAAISAVVRILGLGNGIRTDLSTCLSADEAILLCMTQHGKVNRRDRARDGLQRLANEIQVT
ncbi:hypothetical protein S7711_10639, partial [Stachybotrys chartarum IBT 7711]